MSDLFSTISGTFGKSLILGSFFPAVLFVILWSVLVTPLYSDAPTLLDQPTDERLLLLTTLASVALALILHSFHTPLVRWFEGYPWQETWLGRGRRRLYQRELEGLQARYEGYYELLRKLGRSHPASEEVKRVWNRTGRRLMEELPERTDLVLPTRLGNLIRSFERYPDRQYGMEAIHLWPRLIAVVEESYAKAIEEAETSLALLLHLSFLSLVLGAGLLVTGGVSPPSSLWLQVVLPAALLGLAAWLLYRLALSSAAGWGALIRGAFDLYRWRLLEHLGFEQRPADPDEERELWGAISLQMMYGDRLTPRGGRRPETRYQPISDPPQPRVTARPRSLTLELARGLGRPRGDHGVNVVIEVRNRDSKDRTARDVVVTDEPPKDHLYIAGSARAGGGDVPVTGSGRLQFHLGELPAGQEIRLTYGARPLPSQNDDNPKGTPHD